MMEQGSPEWFAARLGKVTASRISDVMAKGRGSSPSVTRQKYMAQLAVERLTGLVAESFSSSAMDWGTETEPQARASYTMATGNVVEQVGAVEHPEIPMSAASPDGLVGDTGLVEIKCPETHNHVVTLLGGSISGVYVKQMQWQMACTKRDWCDFVSFDPRMPDEMRLSIQRVDRDNTFIAEMEAEVVAFLQEVNQMVIDLREKFNLEKAA